MSKKGEIARAVLFAIVLCGLFFALERYLDGRKNQPTPQHITRIRIDLLENVLYQYREATGSYPAERAWTRSLLVTFFGEENWIDNSDFRHVVESFYDGWGHPMRYRYPGIRNPDGYDLYSLGPDGHDDQDENDDIVGW